MHFLSRKRILLGITGGIAAYKSAELVRRLQDHGAEVRVVMTRGAQEFITPLTMQALSGNPVHVDLLDVSAEAAMGHIELARWADLVLIAPATANTLSKLVVGDASDLLMTLCLATAAPIALAPAMNQGMWLNEATQQNVKVLQTRGMHIFGPGDGGQACGDVGPGRMLEVADILAMTGQLFSSETLAGRKVVITAGPTREAIDPVRYISNYSSGKMGYALAEAAAQAGAETVLISGPVALQCTDKIKRVNVVSAVDMLDAAKQEVSSADIFIGAAAVADYRPGEVAGEKIKKGSEDTMILKMVKNPDIIAWVASQTKKPFVVGFAAETQNVLAYAKGKLERKNLDMIIANDVSDESIGFNSDNNAVTIIDREGQQAFSQRNKSQLARDIVGIISNKIAD